MIFARSRSRNLSTSAKARMSFFMARTAQANLHYFVRSEKSSTMPPPSHLQFIKTSSPTPLAPMAMCVCASHNRQCQVLPTLRLTGYFPARALAATNA
jgi:hypothetical protein